MADIPATSEPRIIRKVVRVTTNQDQPSDYQYWITRPIAERLDAVEMLRQSYLSFRTDVPSRLERVYRVTQLQATHVYKPFKAETFSLGDEVMPERDELYVERGL
ncbi:MAG: hypothetical protein PHE17_11605 [Thiothrix sp.]|uniref:hypothetical protein n=1 Tax=Thiothrix sp. TaxID=1032 RepID=UPI00260F7F15|nr:hypothetical protein [Thiothrix sp.]MDD5393653.1 hypothetical protein [Thiothrix sp.]